MYIDTHFNVFRLYCTFVIIIVIIITITIQKSVDFKIYSLTTRPTELQINVYRKIKKKKKCVYIFIYVLTTQYFHV